MTHAGMAPEARAAAGISETLLRISTGIEDGEDLIADLGKWLPGSKRGIKMSVIAQAGAKGRQLHKFGGSSLADAKCYLRVAGIMKEYSQAGDMMVVSAAGSTTNQLISWLKLSQSDRLAAHQVQQSLRRYHTELIGGLLEPAAADTLIAAFIHDLERLAGLLDGGVSEAVYAEVVGHGEVWSARLMAAVLNQLGMEAAWLDARAFLRAERAAQPQVDEGLSYPLLQQLMAQHPNKRLVVTGFISRNQCRRNRPAGP